MNSLNVHINNLIKVNGLNYSVEKSENGVRAECIDKGFKAFFVKLWQDWFGESKKLHQALEQWVQDDSNYVSFINFEYDSFIEQYAKDVQALSSRGMNWEDPCLRELISNVMETLDVLVNNPPRKLTDQSVMNFQGAIENIKYYMQLFNSYALNYRVRDALMANAKANLNVPQHNLLKNYVAEPLPDSELYSPEVGQRIQNEVNKIYSSNRFNVVGNDIFVAKDINKFNAYWTTCEFERIAENIYPEIAGSPKSRSGIALEIALSRISKISDDHYDTVLADVRESVSNLRNAVYNSLFDEKDINQAIIEYNKHMDDMIDRMNLMCEMDAEIKKESNTLARKANSMLLSDGTKGVYVEYQHIQQQIQSLSDALSNNLHNVNCSFLELQKAMDTYQSEMKNVLRVLPMWTSCICEIRLFQNSEADKLINKLKNLTSQSESDGPLSEKLQQQVHIARNALKNIIDTSNSIPSHKKVSEAIDSYNNELQQINLKVDCFRIINDLISSVEHSFREDVCTEYLLTEVENNMISIYNAPMKLDAAFNFGHSQQDAITLRSCLNQNILEQAVKMGLYQSLLIKAKDRIINTNDVALLEKYKTELVENISPQQKEFQDIISTAVDELRDSYRKGSLPEVKSITLLSPKIQKDVNSIKNINAMLQQISELGEKL